MEDSLTNDLYSWLKTRQIELKQLMDIETQNKRVLLPKVNKLNESLFLYRYEDLLLKNLEQILLLQVYINSEAKIENYEFFTYVSNILANIKETISIPQFDIYSKEFHEYLNYLTLIIQELDKNLKYIEQIMQQKYDAFLFNLKNPSHKPAIEYSLSTIAEKFSIKCSGHLERLSLMKAYEHDWKICKTCHAFICPTCAGNLNICPNLAEPKHELELIGLPLENIVNFLQTDSQRSRSDENFIRMDKEKQSDYLT